MKTDKIELSRYLYYALYRDPSIKAITLGYNLIEILKSPKVWDVDVLGDKEPRFWNKPVHVSDNEDEITFIR